MCKLLLWVACTERSARVVTAHSQNVIWPCGLGFFTSHWVLLSRILCKIPYVSHFCSPLYPWWQCKGRNDQKPHPTEQFLGAPLHDLYHESLFLLVCFKTGARGALHSWGLAGHRGQVIVPATWGAAGVPYCMQQTVTCWWWWSLCSQVPVWGHLCVGWCLGLPWKCGASSFGTQCGGRAARSKERSQVGFSCPHWLCVVFLPAEDLLYSYRRWVLSSAEASRQTMRCLLLGWWVA